MIRPKSLTVYRDDDANIDCLKSKRVVVLGYGKQGHAQSLNLRDSGVNVSVASIRDSSASRAEADGFDVVGLEHCAKNADVLMMLVPDEVQREIYDQHIAPDLGAGKTLCFAHGYNICFDLIKPPAEVDVVMVAPRMIGEVVRRTFEEGTGVPSYVAVHQDASGSAQQTMLAIAKGIGSTRVGAIEFSFDQETAIDLFMEQTLMPIFTKTMLWAFEILVEKGFDPGVVALEMYGSGETAEVFEACAKIGFTEQLLRFHSRTAQYGELSRAANVLPSSVRDSMRNALEEIQNGRFAKEWAAEQQAGYPRYDALIDEARNHPINLAEKRIAEQVDLGSSLSH